VLLAVLVFAGAIYMLVRTLPSRPPAWVMVLSAISLVLAIVASALAALATWWAHS